MKSFLVFFGLTLSSVIGYSQILEYNNTVPLDPTHILDEKLTNISVAYGFRVLESDYNGPLVRLRRDSDNAEQDFTWADDDRLDIGAITTWSAGSTNIFVVTWYDQSGLGRNAIQNTQNLQPLFIPNAGGHPQIRGTGTRYLIVTETNGAGSTIANLTNAGTDGSVLSLMRISQVGTVRGDFGVNCWCASVYGNRDNAFFTPGSTTAGVWDTREERNTWYYHTFVRGPNVAPATNDYARVTLTRTNPGPLETTGVRLNNTNYSGTACTSAAAFRIVGAAGYHGLRQSVSSFTEFIMYSVDIPDSQITEIVENGLEFWGL